MTPPDTRPRRVLPAVALAAAITLAADATTNATDNPTIGPGADDGKRGSTICNDGNPMEPFTGEVAEDVGPERVMDAYCQMVEFNLQNTATGLVLKDIDEVEVRDYAFIKNYLIPEMHAVWDQLVEDNLKIMKSGDEPDPNEGISQAALTLGPMNDSWFEGGYEFNPDGPFTVGGKWSPATLRPSEDNVSRFSMEFTYDTKVYMEKDGDPYVIPITKEIRYSLAEDAVNPGEWLI